MATRMVLDNATPSGAATGVTTGKRQLSAFQQDEQESPFLKGIATIDSILETPTLSLTKQQTSGLVALRGLLVRETTKKTTPSKTGILSPFTKRNAKHKDGVQFKDDVENFENQGKRGNSRKPQRRCSVPQILLDYADLGDTAATFLLEEYGGIRNYHPENGKDMYAPKKRRATSMKITRGSTELESFRKCQMLEDAGEAKIECVEVDPGLYLPQEWNLLKKDDKKKLENMLTWDSLSRWEFDIFQLAKLSRGNPLLFVGWALLGSPHAQKAMANEFVIVGGKKMTTTDKGYDFVTKYNMHPKVLCTFLRFLERNYHSQNPYHNEIHAADVLQTTHALLELGASTYASGPLQIFSLLLSAAIHDVGHPGTTNLFQVKMRTDLALLYNDHAVLENMHLSTAFRRLMGSERQEELDILQGMEPDQVGAVRDFVIKSVKGTDMSCHFDDVERLKSRLDELGESSTTLLGGKPDFADPKVWLAYKSTKDGESAATEFLLGLLHFADLSNPAKPAPLVELWADRILEEFFAQGDVERRNGMKLSPLCDRKTTRRCDSQVGFIKYVVKPAYEALGRLVPGVTEKVLPILEKNLIYWEKKAEHDKENAPMVPDQRKKCSAKEISD